MGGKSEEGKCVQLVHLTHSGGQHHTVKRLYANKKEKQKRAFISCVKREVIRQALNPLFENEGRSCKARDVMTLRS